MIGDSNSKQTHSHTHTHTYIRSEKSLPTKTVVDASQSQLTVTPGGHSSLGTRQRKRLQKVFLKVALQRA